MNYGNGERLVFNVSFVVYPSLSSVLFSQADPNKRVCLLRRGGSYTFYENFTPTNYGLRRHGCNLFTRLITLVLLARHKTIEGTACIITALPKTIHLLERHFEPTYARSAHTTTASVRPTALFYVQNLFYVRSPTNLFCFACDFFVYRPVHIYWLALLLLSLLLFRTRMFVKLSFERSASSDDVYECTTIFFFLLAVSCRWRWLGRFTFLFFFFGGPAGVHALLGPTAL